MPAPKGNQFWKARSSHGRKPKFQNSDDLWQACTEYFEWVENNPLIAIELVKFQGEAKQAEVPKMRPMTETGLCIFLDIGYSTWNDYKNNNDFSDITTRVSEIIYNQKFAGATADLMNANLIARDLGIKDTSKIVTDDGKGNDAPVGSIDVSKLSDSALKELINLSDERDSEPD